MNEYEEKGRFYELGAWPILDSDGNIECFTHIVRDITERKRREKEYKQLIDGMNDTAFVINFEGKFVEINDTAVENLGYSREELLTMGPIDIDPHLSADDIGKLIEGMKSDERQVFETEHQTRSGKIIPVEISSSPVTYQGKSAILSVARDISERKRAEENIRRVTEGAHAILWRAKVTRLEDESKACQGFSWDMHYVNLDTASKFLPLQAHPSNDLEERYHHSILEEDRLAMEATGADALRNNAEGYEQEFRLRDANGALHWMHEDVRINRLDDTHFELIGFIINITQLKRAELEKKKLLYDVRERYKELNLLYEVSRYSSDPEVSLESLLYKTTERIPHAWQYPEITCARIVLENWEFKTDNFKKTKWKQSAGIKINDQDAGSIQVYYLKEKPERDEGPFLREERELIDTLGRLLGNSAQRKRAEVALKQQNKFNQLRAELWKLASGPLESESGLIQKILDKAGPVMDVSRATFVRLDSEKKEYVVQNQWYTAQAGPSPTQAISYRFAKQLFGRKYVTLPEDLIPGIKQYVTQKFKENNIRSYLVVPFGDKSNPQGLFTFSECRRERKWSQQEINTLLEMVNIVAMKSADIKAQRAIRESEASLKEAQALGRIGSWEYDIKMQKITWSDQTYKLYERDPGLGPPKPGEEAVYYSLEQKKLLHDYASRAIEKGKSYKYDQEVQLPSGKTAYFAITLKPVKDNSGNVIQLQGTVQDITQRKQDEFHIRNLNRMYALLSQINQGIIRAGDQEELFKTVCQVAIDYGHFRMAWLGLLDEDSGQLQPVAHSGYEKDYLDDIKITLKDEKASKSPIELALRNGKIKICNDIEADPSMAPWREAALKRGYRSSVAIPFRYKNQVIGALNLYAAEADFFSADERKLLKEIELDISYAVEAIKTEQERQQTEKDLRESEIRYRTIFENTGVATVIIEADTTLSFVNRQFEKVSGYKKEELEGEKSWTEFVVEEDLDRMKEYHARRRGDPTSVPNQYEFRFKDREGKIKDILLTIAMIPGTKNSVASLLDITDQRQLEEQLQQAQKLEAVGQLTGGVAHDFNNLLTVIQGNAQILESKIEPSDPFLNYIAKIIKATKRAAGLTKQLLLFSRKEAMVFEPLDLNRLIDDLLKMLKRLIGEDITVRTDLAADLWTIEGDDGNIEQVIMNLAVNARDAMPNGGKLILKTENIDISEADAHQFAHVEPGKYVRLVIEDSGAGMNKETLDKIFDPFFTTKQAGKGTGLGLSVVYGIVKKHNGWINVYSELGHGTTVRIYFPARSISVEEQAEEEIQWEKLQGNGERILLIEDDPDVREFGKDILLSNGYTVDIAADAAQALKQFKKRKGKYDLIISDVVLPDVNGVALVAQLQSIKSDVPVIMSSGYTEEKSKRAIIEERRYPFIQKPFDIEKMLTTVKQTLGKQP